MSCLTVPHIGKDMPSTSAFEFSEVSSNKFGRLICPPGTTRINELELFRERMAWMKANEMKYPRKHLQDSLDHFDFQSMNSSTSPSPTLSSGGISGLETSEEGGPLSVTNFPCAGEHACSHCTATFPTRELAEKHELLHSPNQLLTCKLCNKGFANVYRLQRHMISHDESALLRKFKCNDCDKAFKFKHHLKEHVRIHSGEKPFGCKNCGKRFSHSGSYSSHMTSKKCISMMQKFNNQRNGGPTKLDTAIGSLKGTTNNNFDLTASNLLQSQLSNTHRNSGSMLNTNQLNNNGSIMPMLKYTNDAMNAAILALQNSFYSMAPLEAHNFLPPFMTPRFFETPHTSIATKQIDNKNDEPRHHHLHLDPEDMIEEVVEDVVEDNANNNMDVSSVKIEKHDHDMRSSIDSDEKSRGHDDIIVKYEKMDEDDNTDMDMKSKELRCTYCNTKFNHQTELVQHEKVLCAMLPKPENYIPTKIVTEQSLPSVFAYNQLVSSSEDDGDDSMKMSGDQERKVRVRTAISEEQQNYLKEHYKLNPRPNREEFRTIAEQLMLDARVVQVWFQNNRSRERKLNNGNGSSKPFVPSQPIQIKNSSSASPKPITTDQPLDLSVKRGDIGSTLTESIEKSLARNAGLFALEKAINFSRKSSLSPSSNQETNSLSSMLHHNEFFQRQSVSPQEAMQAPLAVACGLMRNPPFSLNTELNRNTLLGMKTDSISPNSEKRWRGDESRSSMEDDTQFSRASKRNILSTSGPSKKDSEGEGQFVCDQCDKAFSKQSSLARHKYEHSGQRPYQCADCPKAFKHKHHLTEHKRLHSGEKPFQCCKCLKRFSHSGSYSQHMNHRYSYCKPYRE